MDAPEECDLGRFFCALIMYVASSFGGVSSCWQQKMGGCASGRAASLPIPAGAGMSTGVSIGSAEGRYVVSSWLTSVPADSVSGS